MSNELCGAPHPSEEALWCSREPHADFKHGGLRIDPETTSATLIRWDVYE